MTEMVALVFEVRVYVKFSDGTTTHVQMAHYDATSTYVAIGTRVTVSPRMHLLDTKADSIPSTVRTNH